MILPASYGNGMIPILHYWKYLIRGLFLTLRIKLHRPVEIICIRCVKWEVVEIGVLDFLSDTEHIKELVLLGFRRRDCDPYLGAVRGNRFVIIADVRKLSETLIIYLFIHN